jgi:hypothetical protein
MCLLNELCSQRHVTYFLLSGENKFMGGDCSLQTLRGQRWGMKLLGGFASWDKLFIEGVAMKKVVRVVELISLLPDQLRDPYSQFLLLQLYMDIANLF